jgi:hypothetical protein
LQVGLLQLQTNNSAQHEDGATDKQRLTKSMENITLDHYFIIIDDIPAILVVICGNVN